MEPRQQRGLRGRIRANSLSSVSAERLPWCPIYVGDWLADTRGWPLAVRAVYIELLLAQWDVGTLPVDPERLRAIVGGTSRGEWQRAWSYVAPLFPLAKGGRRNLALEQRRQEARA